jgi:catechol 1,2-dioxygenase
MAPSATGLSNAAQKPNSDRFDPTFTQKVLDTMGPKTTPRNRLVLGSLISHLHDFARDVELTIDEWMAGVHFINAVGAIYEASGKKRNESHRLSDILGFESYVARPSPSLTILQNH